MKVGQGNFFTQYYGFHSKYFSTSHTVLPKVTFLKINLTKITSILQKDLYTSTVIRTSLEAQTVKHLPTMQETRVQSLGGEDPLEKEMATHSSTLAWKIPWMEEPGRLQSMGHKESDTTERLHTQSRPCYT